MLLLLQARRRRSMPCAGSSKEHRSGCSEACVSRFLSVLFLRRLYSIHSTATATESATITPMKSHSEAVGDADSKRPPVVVAAVAGTKATAADSSLLFSSRAPHSPKSAGSYFGQLRQFYALPYQLNIWKFPK